MLNTNKVTGIYLACGSTDLRKSVDGLALIIQEKYQMNPLSSELFIFCNKTKDKLKILHWEHNGFWLYYRRLESGKFKWPETEDKADKVSLEELKWLLDGWPIIRGKAHQKICADIV